MNLAPSDSTCSLTAAARRSLDHRAQPLGGGDRLQAGDADAQDHDAAALTVPAAVISIGKKRWYASAAMITAL
jgi:hypothetical protein